jgi:hypothetical protein
MAYVKYVRPNPEIKKDLLEIKSTGSTDSAVSAISARVLAIRKFIKKWQGRISKSFMEKMYTLLAFEVKDIGGKPAMPNVMGYDFTNNEDVQRYVKDATSAFKKLDDYHLITKRGEPFPVEPPVDKFVRMTSQIDYLIRSVEPHETCRFRFGERVYIIQPVESYGGEAVIKLSPSDVEKAKNICNQGRDAKEDQKRLIFLDEFPLDEKESSGTPETPKDGKPIEVTDDTQGTEGSLPDGDPGPEPEAVHPEPEQSNKKVNKGAHRK